MKNTDVDAQNHESSEWSDKYKLHVSGQKPVFGACDFKKSTNFPQLLYTVILEIVKTFKKNVNYIILS